MLIIRLRLSLLAILCTFNILIFQPGESRPMENIGGDIFNFGDTSEESSTIYTLTNSYYKDSPTLDFMGSMPTTGTGPHTSVYQDEPKIEPEIDLNKLYDLRTKRDNANSPEEGRKFQEQIDNMISDSPGSEILAMQTKLKTKAFKEEGRAMLRALKNRIDKTS
ncbi:hypothetical protein BY996DRAFT_6411585 [Phakopsora pachyrhizi]|uniref:Uncharacterized protein n=1 Tax=Phakopsora pachyrhizi TaxID=170000 RepID=A0AAV0BKJ7_PHAPC|nr:hypothetical protein BY996DRAFT_6411585 [Phakopsora pachyrhizi]CAH7686672.1 hypothetical protein PPACK8108_LOCUS21354 [Phakopsora pachyrhizi]